MPTAPLPGIGPFSETGYSRDVLLRALTESDALPRTEIAVATLHPEEIDAEIVSAVERATAEELDLPSWRLFFRGLHILGGRRLPSVYRPLLTLLRAKPERVEDLLGDAVTETLSQILAGVFDGDAEPLMELATDKASDRWVCEAALSSMIFLTFDGRIDPAAFESFLRRIDDERLFADDDDVLWYGWMTAVALLDVAALAPRVRAAFADGRISPDFCDEDHFERLLQDAVERPDDLARFADENLGYIEDVIVALERFRSRDADDSLFSADQTDDDRLLPDVARAAFDHDRAPAHNPYRGVGRNDPCPCGSDKKFKKCCGQAGAAEADPWTPPRH